MSHVVTIDLEVDSLDTLAEACRRLGCELVRDQKAIRWFGRWVQDYHGADAAYRTIDPKTFGQCEHAIKVKGADYDVGIVKGDKPGRWRLYYDNWQGGKGIEAVCGKGLGKLKQEYAAERSRKAMRRQGWNVRQKRLADGRIELTCTR